MTRVDHLDDRVLAVADVKLPIDVASGASEFSCDGEFLVTVAVEGGDNTIPGNYDIGKIIVLRDDFQGGRERTARIV